MVKRQDDTGYTSPAPVHKERPSAQPIKEIVPTKSRIEVRAVPTSSGAIDNRRHLEPDGLFPGATQLREHLLGRVIGQDEALESFVSAWSRLLSGLRDPRRPLLTALLLGPTGVGKTETALTLAEALFGTSNALVRVNCQEYAQGHEVAKLLGSPPGYVGSEIEPLLSQRRLEHAHSEARRACPVAVDGEDANAGPKRNLLIEAVHDPDRGLHSILLFDEIEKAHSTLWNALLGAIEEGEITLGNNCTTNLTRSIILMTSNVGSREMSLAMDKREMGFRPSSEEVEPEGGSLARVVMKAARSRFPAEFINRFDEVLVYDQLGPVEFEQIFEKFLAGITERALAYAGVPLLIRVSDEARIFITKEDADPTLGARPLRRAMERLLVDPLSRLLASGQASAGDVLDVELVGDALAFYRLPRGDNKVVI